MGKVVNISPESYLDKNGVIHIEFDTAYEQSSITDTTISLLYEESIPYDIDYNVNFVDDKKIDVVCNNLYVGKHVRLSIVGGSFGIKFVDGSELDQPIYTRIYEVVDEESASEEGEEIHIEHLQVIETIPDDNYSNYKGKQIIFKFNGMIDASMDSTISDHVLIYIRPPFTFQSTKHIYFPSEGYLSSDSYDVNISDDRHSIIVTFHDDSVPSNAVVNAILLPEIVADGSTGLSSMNDEFEIVFSMNYTPIVIDPNVIRVLGYGEGLTDEAIARLILLNEAIVDMLYTCNLDWNNPPWCVPLYIIESVKSAIAEVKSGVVHFLGGSFSKNLGDLKISYSTGPYAPGRSDLNALYNLLANCCELVGIQQAVPGASSSYPVPYYNKMTYKRFPVLEDRLSLEPGYCDGVYFQRINLRRHMNLFEITNDMRGSNNGFNK